jgi:putative tricarboxylic transport membrane protein
MKKISVLLLTFVFVLTFAGIGAAEEYPSGPIEMIAPSGAGGGWDTTIRSTAKVLEDQDLIDVPLPVKNLSGAGGGVALADMQTKEGEARSLIVYSPPLLLINLTGQTEYSYKDLTPISNLIQDYGVFAVGKESKYDNINEVMEVLKEDPTAITVGGASSPGSMDHIQFLIAAREAGVDDLKKINYVSFQEGQALSNLLGGHIDMVSTGMAELAGLIKSGDIKGLAVTSEERIETGSMQRVPTLIEEGIDTTFINWRGIFGPPNMPEDKVKFWEDKLYKMTQTDQWNDIAVKNGWTQKYRDSEEFASFLEKTNEDYKVILQEIGMYRQK